MKLDIAQVQKVAKLANLKLTPQEEEKFASQLSNILDYIEELNSVDTSSIEPTFNVTGKENVLREDIEKVGLSQEEALLNASNEHSSRSRAKKDGFFVSKGVFNEE